MSETNEIKTRPSFAVIEGGLSGAFAHLAQASPAALREMTQVAGGSPPEAGSNYRGRGNLDRLTKRRNPDL